MTFDIMWIDHGREPECEPNPDYPKGIDIISLSGLGPSCYTKLPYPAKRCGVFIVKCDSCGMTAAVTTAGRPDDPRSLRISCKGN